MDMCSGALRAGVAPPLGGKVAAAAAANFESDDVTALEQPMHDVLAKFAGPGYRFGEAVGDPPGDGDADALEWLARLAPHSARDLSAPPQACVYAAGDLSLGYPDNGFLARHEGRVDALVPLREPVTSIAAAERSGLGELHKVTPGEHLLQCVMAVCRCGGRWHEATPGRERLDADTANRMAVAGDDAADLTRTRGRGSNRA